MDDQKVKLSYDGGWALLFDIKWNTGFIVAFLFVCSLLLTGIFVELAKIRNALEKQPVVIEQKAGK